MSDVTEVKWTDHRSGSLATARVRGEDVYVCPWGDEWRWGAIRGDKETTTGWADTRAEAKAAAEAHARLCARDAGPEVWAEDDGAVTALVRGYRLEVWTRPTGWAWCARRGYSGVIASEGWSNHCASEAEAKQRAVAWVVANSAGATPEPVTTDPTALDRMMRERDAAVARLARLREHVAAALRLHGIDPTTATAADGGIALRQAAADAYKARQALDGPGLYELSWDGSRTRGCAGSHADAARRLAERGDCAHVRRMEVRRLGEAWTFVVDVREVRDVREVDGE